MALLKQLAIAKPHRGWLIRGTRIRLHRTPQFGNYLPLRLFYWFDEDAVHLLYIDYDSDRLQ